MSEMFPKPSLIPRFNPDYNFNNLVYGVNSIIRDKHIEIEKLRNVFGNKSFFFTNFGRTSLYVILRALNLKQGTKIGVPLYSCTVVFDAIVKAGFKPCFIDINFDNYTLDIDDLKKKINDLSAVVVIHTFGRPAEMDEIMEICGDVPVIEDCSHSLLSEYKGRLTGTIGDVSFFSLAKYISAGGGGMILTDNNLLKESIIREINLLEKPSFLYEIKHSFLTYAKSSLYHKPWFGLIALPMGQYIEKKFDLMDNRSFKLSDINRSDLSIFFNKLTDFKNKVKLQRINSFFLIEELKAVRFILPYEKDNTFSNYYLFPIRFQNKIDRDKAHEKLKYLGIDSAKLYSETPLKAEKYYGYEGNCPNGEIIANTVLIIPNYYTLIKKELKTVVKTIKKLEK